MNFSNIIVRMPNWLGDCVMALPVLEDLRNHYPESRITAMCISKFSFILENLSYVDEVFSFEKSKKGDVINFLREKNYDLGILLPNSRSSAWCFWRGKVCRRLGYAINMRSLLLTDAVRLSKNYETQHLVITYKEILKGLGISVSTTSPRLCITEEEGESCWRMLEGYGVSRGATIIGVNPGSAYYTAKCWLPERFRRVTEMLLRDPDVFVLYFGDRRVQGLIDGIVQGLSKRAISLAGKTSLRELIAAIKLCRVFLTNDGGPMHIAAALNVPLVALFGSTCDVATGPYGGDVRVIHKHVDCSPCFKRDCPKDFKCMKSISEDEVYKEIKKLL